MPEIRSTETLLEVISSGENPKFIFFWGNAPAKDGSVTKSCFSQWWEAPFTIDGILYPTAEHYMMAAKARLFGDGETLQKILDAGHPKQAKDLGRAVADFDEMIWESARSGLVVAGNEAKFRQNPILAAYLLGTGGRVLVEASPVDCIWGIGLAGDHPDAARPENWQGLNLLGFALMEVRDRLRSTES